jgi:hypothetical protein
LARRELLHPGTDSALVGVAMTYVNINDADVLAMGASEFGEENNPHLSLIVSNCKILVVRPSWSLPIPNLNA